MFVNKLYTVLFEELSKNSMFKVIWHLISFNGQVTILVIIGINSDLHSFRSEVGIGSNIHNLDGDFKTPFLISSTDTGVNCDSFGYNKISSITFIKAFGFSKNVHNFVYFFHTNCPQFSTNSSLESFPGNGDSVNDLHKPFTTINNCLLSFSFYFIVELK